MTKRIKQVVIEKQRKRAFPPDALLCHYQYEDAEAHWFHAHRGIEMLYIHEGTGEIMAENRTYAIQKGMLVCFQPYQLHRVAVPAVPGRSYIRTNLTFDPEILDPYLAPFPSLDAFFRDLCRDGEIQQVLHGMDQTSIPAVLGELNGILNNADDFSKENVGLILLRLLRLVQQNSADFDRFAAAARSRGERHGENIEVWLDANYKQPFRLEKVADALHLSPYHVSHVFKAYSGMTITDYLIRRRVREACVLLANTDLSVRQIAAELGGLSASHFSQMFRRVKGVTPEDYRGSIR